MNLKLNNLFACLHAPYWADIIYEIDTKGRMTMKKLIAAGGLLLFVGLYYVVGMGG